MSEVKRERRYLATGAVAHLLPPGSTSAGAVAECGRRPNFIHAGDEGWLGAGSPAEHAVAAATRLCRRCRDAAEREK